MSTEALTSKELRVDISRALSGFTLRIQFRASGRIGVLGASGSGKSMTLRCIAGLDTPDRGVITCGNSSLFDNEQHINLPSRKRKVGFLFQNYALFPHMTVAQNIRLALRGFPAAQAEAVLREQTASLQVDTLLDRYPDQLSGGQQQRVALARALAGKPNILLLDEPFSALDGTLRWQLESALQAALEAFPGPVVYVSHNQEEVYRLCDTVLIVDKGRVVDYGLREEIFNHPRYEASARLTGCQNISAARPVGPHTLEALDWGLTLQTAAPVPETLHAVGLHAHAIMPGEGNLSENTFSLPVRQVLKSPQTFTAMLGDKEPICWEFPRESSLSMPEAGETVLCRLPPQKLLLLGKNPE